MRIIICCNMYPPNFIGGAELISHHQAKALISLGHQVIIFSGDNQRIGKQYSLRKELFDSLTIYRIRLTRTDYNPEFNNFSHPAVEKHFVFLLDQFKPDIVHFHNIIGLSVSIIHIAKTRGIKTILTLHDYWGFCYKNTIIKYDDIICSDFSRCYECQPFIHDGQNRNIPIKLRQDFITLQLCDIDAFISPSYYLSRTYIKAGLPFDKMHVVWNGVDVDKFATIQKKPRNGIIRFSFIGYFGKHKGVHILLQALAILNDNYKYKCRINLVGDGDQKESYQQLLKENGCNKLVKFWGKIDNTQITDVFRETDILVLPSIWLENQPVSITEAMACYTPVIASDMGGILELVEDGKTGFIFKSGDENELAKKMITFIQDETLIEKFGKNAYQKIKENSFFNQTKKILDVYQDSVCNLMQSQEKPLIICLGNRFSSACIRALDLIPTYYTKAIPNITMIEWLTKDQIEKGSLFWIVDENFDLKKLTDIYFKKIPLLVPVSHSKLVQLCRITGCGLYYQDADEAAACIAYLLDDKITCLTLGRNVDKIQAHNNYLF